MMDHHHKPCSICGVCTICDPHIHIGGQRYNGPVQKLPYVKPGNVSHKSRWHYRDKKESRAAKRKAKAVARRLKRENIYAWRMNKQLDAEYKKRLDFVK
jgi:hypothetical protein